MAKKRKVRINKIGIQIGNSEHELTLSEARSLRDALDDLLGVGTITITPVIQPRDRIIPIPYPQPYPVPVWPTPRPWQPMWTTTCRSNTNTVWLSKTAETTGGAAYSA